MLHYKPFPTFILRTPCYPLDKLDHFDKDHYTEDLFFADALFQASPELYELAFEKKRERIK
ncbi:MAG: hypothetical protein LUG51_15545 [Tannerellaceae bacterium]|nr:hypothetical protein [Tannerellaceae bacterium]